MCGSSFVSIKKKKNKHVEQKRQSIFFKIKVW
jgi:hypothetical protein